jgi:hypothetical protein
MPESFTVPDESLPHKGLKVLPPEALQRLLKACVCLEQGYPYIPDDPPKYMDEFIKSAEYEKYHPLP